MTIPPASYLMPPLARAAHTRPEGDSREISQAREVARDFEALLVSQMIAAMRKTIPNSGLLEASASRRTLDDAFDYEFARALVADGSLGFAQQIEARLLARSASVAPAARTAAVAEAEADTVVPGGAEAPPPQSTGGDPVVGPQEHASDLGAPPTLPLERVRMTSEFGMRLDPFTRQQRFHGGVDLAAPTGTPIRVAADGEVVFSGRRGGAGNLVEVRHAGGLTTSYAHADRTLVEPGQKVAAGAVIATVGSTGRSTGPHLHFSVQRGGQAMDPTGFLPDLRG